MKILIQTSCIILLTILVQTFLPWWSLMLICFLVCFFLYGTRGSSFISGLLGIALVWTSYAFYIDITTSSILTSKVANIFQLPEHLIGIPGSALMIMVTGIVGGLAGGFSALSGHLFREIFSR